MSFPDRHGYSSIRKELARKLIHISGFSIPFIAIATGNLVTALLIVGLATSYCISEYYRLHGRRIPVLTAVTKTAMRSELDENQSTFIRAPLYFAAGILASLLIFPAPFNYAAIVVVTLGDGIASIIGRMYGAHRIRFTGGKTLEGTAAGAACAFGGALIFVSPTTALVVTLVGMAVELIHLRISDNLTVPLLSGLMITVIGNP